MIFRRAHWVFWGLIGICLSSYLHAKPLQVYAPSSFVAWLAEHIAGDAVNVSANSQHAQSADLRVFLDSVEANPDIAKLPQTVFLSDGLPAISTPEGFPKSATAENPNRWLHLEQVLFMAVGLSETLAEHLPEHADAFDEARARFSKTIRLEDFQIKRRLRALEQSVALDKETAQALFPLLSYYDIACTVDGSLKATFSIEQPQPGDSPEGIFVAITNQLLGQP